MNPLYYVIYKFLNGHLDNDARAALDAEGKVFYSSRAVGIYMLGRALNDYIVLKQDDQGVRVFDLVEPDVFKFEKQLTEF